MLQASVGSVRNLMDRTYVSVQLQKFQKKEFDPYLSLQVDTSRYLVKTASTREEFDAVLRLRYEVFLKEELDKNYAFRVDIDRYDGFCDHLIIIDKRTQSCVGTYRLISSHITNSFYSENEFDLTQLLRSPGHKLELGRACIAKAHRNGIVLGLLWRGIMDYCARTSTKYLFGCASIKITKNQPILQLYRYVKSQPYWSDRFQTTVAAAFAVPGMEHLNLMPPMSEDQAAELLPSLLVHYLRAGAIISGEPAFDKEFKCIDFLTVMDVQGMQSRYQKRYGSSSEGLTH